MKTLFLLMAQYDGLAIIPLERICADYFTHLTPAKLKMKAAAGQIDLSDCPNGEQPEVCSGRPHQ